MILHQTLMHLMNGFILLAHLLNIAVSIQHLGNKVLCCVGLVLAILRLPRNESEQNGSYTTPLDQIQPTRAFHIE